jgi:deoxyribodipyrimidine photo-lyase
MAAQPVHDTRIQRLNDLEPRKGRYVLYWMQQSQRAEYNHALEYAAQQANALGQGVLVGFGLMEDYPEANLRHYTFMLEGLLETQASLSEQGIKMIVQRGSPVDVASTLGRNASLIVCDRGYLRHQKTWRTRVARSASWVFGVHDRAWFERPIFGKIRYMAPSGLEKKCDIRGYVKKVESLAKRV